MRLKRHYVRDADGAVTEDGKRVLVLDEVTGRPVLSHVELQHTGTKRAQNFSDGLVVAGLKEGWITIKGGVLTLDVQPEPLAYTILRVPGKYPSDVNASGYEVISAYECVLDEQQHAKYCAKTLSDRVEAMHFLRGVTPKVKSHMKKEVSVG